MRILLAGLISLAFASPAMADTGRQFDPYPELDRRQKVQVGDVKTIRGPGELSHRDLVMFDLYIDGRETFVRSSPYSDEWCMGDASSSGVQVLLDMCGRVGKIRVYSVRGVHRVRAVWTFRPTPRGVVARWLAP